MSTAPSLRVSVHKRGPNRRNKVPSPPAFLAIFSGGRTAERDAMVVLTLNYDLMRFRLSFSEIRWS